MADLTDKSFTSSTSGTTLTSASEGTVITAARGARLAFNGGQVVVKGWANLTLNTSATGVEYRLYSGLTTAGTEIAVASAGYGGLLSSGGFDINIQTSHQLGAVSSNDYCMTVTPVTTGSGGTVRQAALEIEVLN